MCIDGIPYPCNHHEDCRVTLSIQHKRVPLSMNNNTPVKGSCLCGRVTLTVKQFDRDVVACHCGQCRKQTGTYVSAANTADSNLHIEGGEHLTWYAASDFAKRGFCRECGSLLFWKDTNSEGTSIMAGCLDAPTGLTTQFHIYTTDKGDFYTIDDGKPQYPQSDA